MYTYYPKPEDEIIIADSTDATSNKLIIDISPEYEYNDSERFGLTPRPVADKRHKEKLDKLVEDMVQLAKVLDVLGDLEEDDIEEQRNLLKAAAEKVRSVLKTHGKLE